MFLSCPGNQNLFMKQKSHSFCLELLSEESDLESNPFLNEVLTVLCLFFKPRTLVYQCSLFTSNVNRDSGYF